MERDNDMQKIKPTAGIRCSVRDEYLRWADGSLIDPELYSDFTWESHNEALAMTEEEVYAVSLEAGLPRDPRIEKRLNMLEVEQLLGERSY
jgi:hypothetical protein